MVMFPVQALVSSPGSAITHSFDLRLVVPQNACFAPQSLESLPVAAGSVSFTIDDGPKRVQQWLQSTYQASDCALDAAGNLRQGFIDLRDGGPLVITAGAHPCCR